MVLQKVVSKQGVCGEGVWGQPISVSSSGGAKAVYSMK